MQHEEAILVKVDKPTKEKMKKLNINWSKAIRGFISEELNRKRNLAKAVALTDKLFRKAKKKGFDSTAFIRKMRSERYGPDSG